ncbi:MAG: FAD-binding protein [Bacteroidales bacterium]|nr:FAD-binding protein [Bacteroidales bacterium]
MIKRVEIAINASDKNNKQAIKKALLLKLGKSTHITGFFIVKRSLDARQANVLYRMHVDVWVDEKPSETNRPAFDSKNVESCKPIIIVGSGPAGLFAALKAIELGRKPILIERGKAIEERKKDVALLNRGQVLSENSNWCFGEGGAGTYTDGKLYTRASKRGNVNHVLQTFVQFGAHPDILIDAHPHIGTDKLPSIIKNMRLFIESCGGIFYFDTQIVDFKIIDRKIQHLISQNGDVFEAPDYVLATGHSSKEIYELLHRKSILLESKDFAIGVRIELPQLLVDKSLYKNSPDIGVLPPAEYRLATQIGDRGVFSFCMCPGGVIVPATTHHGFQVVNGMSNSLRNSEYANSGLVVSVSQKDILADSKEGALAGLKFQHKIEAKSWNSVPDFQAPAQRVDDFILKKESANLPKSTYNPGIVSTNLWEILPHFVCQALSDSMLEFDRKIKGFNSSEACFIGVETRTSSPVRIPRDREKFSHPQIENLFPCGEGAGYAGGITSSAMDGINCMESIINN